jgi:hypothetical protein
MSTLPSRGVADQLERTETHDAESVALARHHTARPLTVDTRLKARAGRLVDVGPAEL